MGVKVKRKEKPKKKCAECGKIINRGLTKYCNNLCKDKAARRRKRLKKKEQISEKDLDILWAKVIKLRDGKCQVPGCKKDNLNAHHIYSRSARSVRWELDNGISLCAGHHTLKSEFSAHRTPVEFTEFLIEVKGQEFMDNLKQLKNSIDKPDRAEIKEYLEGELKKYEV